MEQKVIPLLSLQRNLPKGSDEGFCDEFINLRRRNNAWRPVGEKEKLYDIPDYDKIYIHSQDIFSNWIGYNQSSGDLVHYNPSTKAVIQTIANIGEEIYSIRSLKNFLVILTESNKYIFLFDETYSEISLTGLEYFFGVSLTSDNVVAAETELAPDADGLLGKYYKKLNELSGDSQFIGAVSYRIALKLFDGSYIMHTVPKIFQFYPYANFTLVNSGGDYKMTFGASGVKATAYFSSLLDPDKLEKIKPAVSSICLFFSKNEPFYDISEDTITETNLTTWLPAPGNILASTIIDVSEDFKKLPDSPLWYLAGEISLENLVLTGGIYLGEMELDLVNFYQNYGTRRTLPIDNYTHHNTTGKASYIYNDRLMLGSTKQTIGLSNILCEAPVRPLVVDPINASIVEYTYDPVNDTFQGIVVTTLKSSNQTKTIVQNISLIVYKNPSNNTKKAVFLHGTIGYFDSRAKNIKIYIEIGGSYYLIFNQNLTESLYSNFAYYTSGKFDAEDVYEVAELPARYDNNLKNTVIWFNSSLLINPQTIPDVNNTIIDNNNVQVSDPSNPFIFDVKNYQPVSDGEILAFGTNTDPISDSQYGQFPVYVFTSLGIWALLIGTGETYITNVTPLNGDVILNKDAKVDISLGTVYACAEGLKLLSGREPIEISETVEGIPDQYFSDNTQLQYFLNLPQTVNVQSMVDKVRFLTYLQGSIIGYLKQSDNQEIFIANSNYEYTYVFDIKNKAWYKLGAKISMFISNYPNLYAARTTTDKTGIVSMGSEIESNVPCYFHTRPMHISGAYEAIKLGRIFLRGFFNMASGKYASFYIFSSDDAKTWEFVTGNDYNSGQFDNIWVTHSNDSNKYYVFVFAGELLFNNDSVDSYIKHIEIMYQRKWVRKLR